MSGGRTLRLGALAVLLAISACAGPPERAATTRGNTITIVCDPALCGGPFGDTRSLLFLSLTTGDVLEGGEPKPLLAERWEHSADYREWTIHLRSGVRWHDGRPVTARDIEFTLRLWAHPDVLRPQAGALESATALDDSTVRIRYSKPSRAPLASGTVYYPRHILEGLEPRTFSEWDFWRQPTVGNGPYRLVRHVPETLMELEANPDYYGGKPEIERVILKYATPMITELLSGEVDVIHVIEQAAIPRLVRDSRFRVYYQVIPYARIQILWNQRHVPFRDAAVRRALTMALDRRELHRTLNLPGDLPLTEGIFTVEQYRQGDLVAPLPFDPEAAKVLLDAAGWRVGHDGVRERGGVPFRFSLLVSGGGYLGQPAQGAVLIQEQLRRVGVRVDIEQRQVLATLDRVRAGQFEAAIWSTGGGPERDADFFGRGSFIGYSNSRVVELLDSAIANPDIAAQNRFYRELAIIFREDVPATFLYPKVDAHAAHRRVQGLESPYRGDPFWFLARLRLEEQ